jgi:hypothetical protein
MGVAYASANPISSPAAMMMTAVDADKEQKLREQAAGADRSLDRLHARAGHARAGMLSIIASARSTLAALEERAAQQDPEQPECLSAP